LGAGGRINTDVYLTDSSNAALYACFAIVGFFAGSVNNTLGPKYTLLVGCVTPNACTAWHLFFVIAWQLTYFPYGLRLVRSVMSSTLHLSGSTTPAEILDLSLLLVLSLVAALVFCGRLKVQS
jgi:hypothetical protein